MNGVIIKEERMLVKSREHAIRSFELARACLADYVVLESVENDGVWCKIRWHGPFCTMYGRVPLSCLVRIGDDH